MAIFQVFVLFANRNMKFDIAISPQSVLNLEIPRPIIFMKHLGNINFILLIGCNIFLHNYFLIYTLWPSINLSLFEILLLLHPFSDKPWRHQAHSHLTKFSLTVSINVLLWKWIPFISLIWNPYFLKLIICQFELQMI